jgi:hypothetical protein
MGLFRTIHVTYTREEELKINAGTSLDNSQSRGKLAMLLNPRTSCSARCRAANFARISVERASHRLQSESCPVDLSASAALGCSNLQAAVKVNYLLRWFRAWSDRYLKQHGNGDNSLSSKHRIGEVRVQLGIVAKYLNLKEEKSSSEVK